MGVIAQLGERYNGIVEVGGSIPPGSTTPFLFNVLLIDLGSGDQKPRLFVESTLRYTFLVVILR